MLSPVSSSSLHRTGGLGLLVLLALLSDCGTEPDPDPGDGTLTTNELSPTKNL